MTREAGREKVKSVTAIARVCNGPQVISVQVQVSHYVVCASQLIIFFIYLSGRKGERTKNKRLWGEYKLKADMCDCLWMNSSHFVSNFSIIRASHLYLCHPIWNSSLLFNCPVVSLLVAVALAPVLPVASPCWCILLHNIHYLILWWAQASSPVFAAFLQFFSNVCTCCLFFSYRQSSI